jgi:UDP-N-acetylmuramate--alanine ligase
MDDRPARTPRSFASASSDSVVHLIGIAGAGMKALAEWIADAGYRVTGSDPSLTSDLQYHYAALGIGTTTAHASKNIGPQTVLVVHSPAVPESNEERRAAALLGIPQMSYPEALASIMRQGEGVSIAGTHGKSSTTAMAASILAAAGRDPSVFCGAEAIDGQRNGASGSGPVIVESCEYRRHFLNLDPRVVAVLNIEADHFDCFANVDEAVAAYREFVGRLPQSGTLVLNADCPRSRSLAESTSARVAWFSLANASLGWFANDIRFHGSSTSFTLRHHDSDMGRISWAIPGRHQIANALAAAAVCDALDVPTDAIHAGLEQYQGLRRRMEFIAVHNGVTVIDDYAHHPTALRATLETLRDQYGGRRIWCAFQPHQRSRTHHLFAEFVDALSMADQVLIPPVFASREVSGPEDAQVSRSLADAIRAHGVPARFVPSLDHISMAIETDARPGDVFLVAGAGSIDRVAHDISRRLQRHHAS